ncbi:MAG TPA: 2-amino-4-hydroxy-6-hydroxymethyldihydropteridine diphosphokinase [Polyangiaceae bacterium]|nr:2-amino-4-hydroxy-6-hydroxymethyldihydropteridine diphosphokinase [Polyangiaceae bacterium]
MLAVVGVGANLGDRLASMRSAAIDLARVARVEKTSRVYASAPIGGPLQPDFLNAAAAVVYEGAPLDLLDALLAIEARLGRVRGERWGPRTIDLDLLWIEGVAIDTPRLVVPHPRLHERAFALVPLLEVVPGARDPRTGVAYEVPAGSIRDTGETLSSV